MSLDHWVAACLVIAVLWILASGLDDLFISLAFLFLRRNAGFPWPSDSSLARASQRPIAILVPLWREHNVIGQMLRHNLSVVQYQAYEIFVGVYPNDQPTLEAAAQVVQEDARVHICLCPRDGPTSKADCLNAIYERLLDYEARHGLKFEILVTHDAEDLIHPESLRLINWFSRSYEMVQIPVLPLATPLREWTHGLYCDEFAEFQLKDIFVRRHLGGFLPSNGVGTGFERNALEELRDQHGKLFNPECLTEDYETGFRFHAAGYRQLFVPICFGALGPVATREYFPQHWRAAIRQRSRWIAGITLQGWQHHGWGRSALEAYWFWRDRKGLISNLISPVVNGLPLYRFAIPEQVVLHWRTAIPGWLPELCLISASISVAQMVLRACLSSTIYGWRFAAAVPLRAGLGAFLNGFATFEAIHQFCRASVERGRLPWSKTEHVCDSNAIPVPKRPKLGEVLIRLHLLSMSDLEDALRQKPPGLRIGEFLIRTKKITRLDLEEALTVQASLPIGWPLAESSDLQTRRPARLGAESLRTEPVPQPGAQA